MLITDKFVILNNPKTGSTFVREVIKKIYDRRRPSFLRRYFDPPLRELIVPNIKMTGVKPHADQHGTYTQIPAKYRNRDVVSVVRNPYSRFLSRFRFRWWASNPPISKEIITERLPNFPNLSLDEFVDLCRLETAHSRLKGRHTNAHIGYQTALFIQMFFKSPSEVLNSITDEYLDSENIFDDVAQITFLQQENLNDELAAFLDSHGFPKEDVEFARREGKKNVTKGDPVEQIPWTLKALEYIATDERMIFRLLKSKGIQYAAP